MSTIDGGPCASRDQVQPLSVERDIPLNVPTRTVPFAVRTTRSDPPSPSVAERALAEPIPGVPRVAREEEPVGRAEHRDGRGRSAGRRSSRLQPGSDRSHGRGRREGADARLRRRDGRRLREETRSAKRGGAQDGGLQEGGGEIRPTPRRASRDGPTRTSRRARRIDGDDLDAHRPRDVAPDGEAEAPPHRARCDRKTP